MATKKLTRAQRDNRMFYTLTSILLTALLLNGIWLFTHRTIYKEVSGADLTVVSEEQAYYYLYAALTYPDGFENTFITLSGTYHTYDGYDAVYLSCPESMMEDKEGGADDYSLIMEFDTSEELTCQEGDTIMVTGIFHYYQEGESYYAILNAASVLKS